MPELTLQQRMARLEAIDAIEQLKARYCAFCDDQYDPEGIAGLFVENGIWDGERFGTHVGREAIKAHFRQSSREIPFAAHLTMNPIIELESEDRAKGRWRLIMPSTVRAGGKSEAKWLVVAYDERYVRVAGVWLFESMKVHVNFFEPHLGEGWADTAVG